ncbi:MAG: response regulator [Proteobacteria bacterium]|nr:response regulator [Pseudomonadota bacterium]
MKKILLVDDEESIHLLYREELEEEGYEVHSALSGEEALDKLNIIEPDLVILDINMPGMNGIDVLRRMKEINQSMPVILSSAYQEFKQDLASWASDDYIVKSSNLDELKNAVRKYLRPE